MPILSTIDKTVLKETNHSATKISLFPENFKTGLWKNLNLIFIVSEKSHDVHYTYTSLLSKNPDANYQHPSRLIIKEQVLFHNH